MRLFVAADISPETREQLRRVRDAIEAALPPRHGAKLTWPDPDAAHVTIRFIGETSEAAFGELQSVLRAPIPRAPFETRWTALGSFPGGRRPKVLWLGPGETSSLESLSSLVAERLDAVVGPGESRRFRPHLTVARVREAGRVAWPRVLSAIRPGETISSIDHVTLYRSRLSPRGPAYEALITTPLAAPN